MAKRKTPKVKKEEQKLSPEEARENYMKETAEQLRTLREGIIKGNEGLEKQLDLYVVMYKNLLLEHYKTLNISYNKPEVESERAETIDLKK